MGATVGTVWVGVAPSAVGFQSSLAKQIRGQMAGRGGPVNKAMGQAGVQASRAYSQGFATAPPPKSLLHGPSQRVQRATRRNMTRSGRRAGQSFAQGMGSSMKSTGRSLTFTASGASALALGATAIVSAKFESALSAALAVGEAEELAGKAGEDTAATYARRFNTQIGKDFRAEALKVGKDTVFSNLEAAQGLEILSRGGLTAKQSIEALGPTANLAAAGQLGLAEAANISVSALNQYKRTGISATDAGNQMAVAANKSQATVESLGLSMQYAGAAAANANQSYAGTLTAMTLLGKTGITGSKAGTRTLNFFDGLRGKSEKAKTEIEDLGLKFYKSNGEMKNFVGISKEMQRVFEPMGNKERGDALFTIFGKRGRSLALEAIKTDLTDIQTLYQEIGSADKDALRDLAIAQMGPVARAFELMKGEWETALSNIGKSFEGSTVGVLEWIEDIAVKINAMDSEKMLEFGKTFAKRLAIIAAIGPGFWLGGAAIGAAKKLAGAFQFLGNQAAIAWGKMQLFATAPPLRGLLGKTGVPTNLLPVTPYAGLGKSRVPTILPVDLTHRQKRILKKNVIKQQKYVNRLGAGTGKQLAKNAGAAYPLILGGQGRMAKAGNLMLAPFKKLATPLRAVGGLFGKALAPAKALGKAAMSNWRGWVRSGTSMIRFGKMALTATGIGAVMVAAFEGVHEAITRSSEQEGGGFLGNLTQAWENLKGIGEGAAQAFEGVGEAWSEMAQVTGLDALWGAIQSGLASAVEGLGWLIEFFTSQLPNAIATAADAIFSFSTGIQRAVIAWRKLAAFTTRAGDDVWDAIHADEAKIDAAQDLHEYNRGLRDQAKAQKEATTAAEKNVKVITDQGAAYKDTKSALEKYGLLETAVQSGDFVLKGKNVHQNAEILLGKEFAGKPLKVTVPVQVTVGEETGVARALTFKKGSVPGLQKIFTEGKDGDRQRRFIRFISEEDHAGMTDEQQNLFAQAMLPGGKEGYVQVKMELVADPDSPLDIGGKPTGELLLTPKLDPAADPAKIDVPKRPLKLEPEVDPVTDEDLDYIIPPGAIMDIPAHPVLVETGVPGATGITTLPAMEVPVIPKWTTEGPIGPPIEPVEVPTIPNWTTAGPIGAPLDMEPVTVPLKPGPELAQGVELVMAEATTQMNTLTQDRKAIITVETPGLEEVKTDVKSITSGKKGKSLIINVKAPGSIGVKTRLEKIKTLAKPREAAITIIKAGFKSAITQLEKIKGLMTTVDGMEANPPVTIVGGPSAILTLGTVAGLLSSIDGRHASASVTVTAKLTGTRKALDALGGGAPRQMALPGDGGGGGSGVGASYGAAPSAGTRSATSSGGLSGGLTRAGSPITGGLSGIGKSFKNYKRLLRQLKKAMRKLRGAGVAEIDQTTKAFDKSLKKFERVTEPKDLKKDPTKKQKKRHRKQVRLWKKQVRVLKRNNDRLAESATKRKDSLTQINDDTKNYLSAATRSFQFAGRGTSEQILAGVKELEDTFTLADIPSKQKNFLRQITANDRAALAARGKDLERFEKAREFRDQVEEQVKGTVDWSKFVNAGDLTRQLGRVTADMAAYQEDLVTLRGRGVTKEVVEKLAEGDPARARLLAKNLARATGGEIAALNTAFNTFLSQAKATGDTAAGAAFGEIGKGAMTGFAKGMAAEEKQIRAKVTRITNRIVRTVKRALGIKSPSTVFAGIGRDMMRGIVVGVTAESLAVRQAVLDGAIPGSLAASSAGRATAEGAGGNGGVNISVYPAAGMNERELADLVGKEFLWAAG